MCKPSGLYKQGSKIRFPGALRGVIFWLCIFTGISGTRPCVERFFKHAMFLCFCCARCSQSVDDYAGIVNEIEITSEQDSQQTPLARFPAALVRSGSLVQIRNSYGSHGSSVSAWHTLPLTERVLHCKTDALESCCSGFGGLQSHRPI